MGSPGFVFLPIYELTLPNHPNVIHLTLHILTSTERYWPILAIGYYVAQRRWLQRYPSFSVAPLPVLVVAATLTRFDLA